MITKINIPNVFVIRGGDGSGKTVLSEKIGESYKSWGYFNLSTREELEKLKCIVICCDSIYSGLFGHPVDIFNLNQFNNSEIFYAELSEQIEICLRLDPITIVVVGITCYQYLIKLDAIFKDRATMLSFEMVGKHAYPRGMCLYPDSISLADNPLYPYTHTIKMLRELILGSERPSLFERAYQYFPEFEFQKTYSSDSPEKFRSLNLPDIRDKRVLDVGCNLGYFVFQYRKMGALAEGLDIERDLIVKASKIRNIMYSRNDVTFYCGDIFKFQEKKYDLISMLSAFHYFREKQNTLIQKIYYLLNEGGVFILEMCLSRDNLETEYIEKYIRQEVDPEPCYFPNEKAFRNMINNLFEITYEGVSVQQAEDKLAGKVFHLKKI